VGAGTNFTAMSTQSFLVYRMLVTRVERMGDGSAEIGELVLYTDPQRFQLADPETSLTPVVPWALESVDPWAPIQFTFVQAPGSWTLPLANAMDTSKSAR